MSMARSRFTNHDAERGTLVSGALEEETPEEEMIELTGKVLGDGGDYHASISGGRGGRPNEGDGLCTRNMSRSGSQECILVPGEGIMMTKEVKIVDT